jgi:hypothetical protein
VKGEPWLSSEAWFLIVGFAVIALGLLKGFI